VFLHSLVKLCVFRVQILKLENCNRVPLKSKSLLFSTQLLHLLRYFQTVENFIVYNITECTRVKERC